MMIIAALFLLTQFPADSPWYGPEKVTFDLHVNGSPYDATTNDVKVRFTGGNHSEDRFAYFDGRHWNAFLLTHQPGDYQAQVLLNGVAGAKLSPKTSVHRLYTSWFVRADPSGQSFRLSDGKPFWPAGHSLGWQDPSCPPLVDQIAIMGKSHMNWSRIWANTWDGKNPYWPQDNRKLADRDMAPEVYTKWDSIVSAASSAGIHFQWVLFHHGEFATMVDPNWKEHPWNRANGGFLNDPKLFFTDAEAKLRAKNYLRYVVARYGHETSIMAWELFNEVENTDAAKQSQWSIVADWHREMAAYLRAIDPYHHLITSSSELNPGVVASLDYYQPHGYPSNVAAMIQGAKVPSDKPFFFGEVGLAANPMNEAAQRNTVRDAIWTGLLCGHAGAAQYWYWDLANRYHLENEFAKAHAIIGAMGIVPGPRIVPIQAVLKSDGTGNLVFTPGLSWAPSKRLQFQFPADGSNQAMGTLSSFLQGTNHADMGNKVSFGFDARSGGEFMVRVGTAARAGADMKIDVDGRTVFTKAFPGSANDSPVNQEFKVPFAKGKHEILVSNGGTDWISVQSYTFTGLGSPANILASKTDEGVIARIHKLTDGTVTTQLSGLPLTDGKYLLKSWGLDSGGGQAQTVTLIRGVLSTSLSITEKDVILSLEKAK